jgi:hypothetical protein
MHRVFRKATGHLKRKKKFLLHILLYTLLKLLHHFFSTIYYNIFELHTTYKKLLSVAKIKKKKK